MTTVAERTEVADFRVKFKRVMAGRQKVESLLKVYELLIDSVNYTEAEKFQCYAMLVEESTKRVPKGQHLPWLNSMRRSNAMRQVREAVSADDADRLAAGVVRRVLESCDREPEVLVKAIKTLIRAKVAADRGQVFSFAVLSGMPLETLDAISDLTFDLC